MVFLAAENENRLLEDLTQADFVQFWLYVYLKDSYIGKDKVDNWEFWEFFVSKITPIVVFAVI